MRLDQCDFIVEDETLFIEQNNEIDKNRTMRQIEDFFSSKPSGTLFHYTGIDSLLKIVESNSIWASCVYYLTDSKEISYACEFLLSEIINHWEEDGDDEFLDYLGFWINSCKTT